MDVKLFLKEFNLILSTDLPNILISLDTHGYWSDGVDNISLVYMEDGNSIRSIMVTMLEIWGRGILVDYRFSVPKFLDILEKQKKEYLQLHPLEAETVESEFEKFQQKLLRQWGAE